MSTDKLHLGERTKEELSQSQPSEDSSRVIQGTNYFNKTLNTVLFLTAIVSPTAGCVSQDADIMTPDSIVQKEEIRLAGYTFLSDGVQAEFLGINESMDVDCYVNGNYIGKVTINNDGTLKLSFDNENNQVEQVTLLFPPKNDEITLKNDSGTVDLFEEAGM